MKLFASCIKLKMKSFMVSNIVLVKFMACDRSFFQKLLLINKCLNTGYKALSVFNVLNSTCSHQTRNWQNQYILISSEQKVGGEREEELEEDGHADAQTRGPGNVLSMFL